MIYKSLTMAAFFLSSHLFEESRIVGSSTVEPLATQILRGLDPSLGLSMEATGSNAGIEAFCSSTNPFDAPVTLSSRKMTAQERADCEVRIEEHTLGANGVALVVNKRSELKGIELTREDLFRALAARIPGDDCSLRQNPTRTWKDVRAELPDVDIAFYGPGSTSGTRTVFVELAMTAGAKADACMRELDAKAPGTTKSAAKNIRNDGVWKTAAEDDVEVIADLHRQPTEIGIMGYSSATRFERHITFLEIDGVQLSSVSISDGSYPLSGRLYLYANGDALEANPAARAFVEAFTSDEAIGPEGSLVDHGLIAIGR